MTEPQAGLWFRSETRFGPLFHAHLFAGQENSGKLVTLVKREAVSLAREQGLDLVLVDGPPGIGCPVISACSGADLALLVVEPTVAGVHDMERVLATASHFGVPSVAMINKADINPRQAEGIVAACKAQGVPVVGQIPYDDAVTEAIVQGKPMTEHGGPASRAIREAWANGLRRHVMGEVVPK